MFNHGAGDTMTDQESSTKKRKLIFNQQTGKSIEVVEKARTGTRTFVIPPPPEVPPPPSKKAPEKKSKDQ